MRTIVLMALLGSFLSVCQIHTASPGDSKRQLDKPDQQEMSEEEEKAYMKQVSKEYGGLIEMYRARLNNVQRTLNWNKKALRLEHDKGIRRYIANQYNQDFLELDTLIQSVQSLYPKMSKPVAGHNFTEISQAMIQEIPETKEKEMDAFSQYLHHSTRASYFEKYAAIYLKGRKQTSQDHHPFAHRALTQKYNNCIEELKNSCNALERLSPEIEPVFTSNMILDYWPVDKEAIDRMPTFPPVTPSIFDPIKRLP